VYCGGNKPPPATRAKVPGGGGYGRISVRQPPRTRVTRQRATAIGDRSPDVTRPTHAGANAPRRLPCGRFARSGSRGGAGHAPPTMAVTMPVPPHSGQASLPTFPLPPQRRQTVSPVPGDPAGASSPGLVSGDVAVGRERSAGPAGWSRVDMISAGIGSAERQPACRRRWRPVGVPRGRQPVAKRNFDRGGGCRICLPEYTEPASLRRSGAAGCAARKGRSWGSN
jgi:hypothetical protein